MACLLLQGLLGLSCSPAPGVDGQPANTTAREPGSAPQSGQSDAAFARLVDQWTGGKARPLPGRNPDHYFGDFDGDGNQDAVVPIQFTAKGASRELPNVQVLNPWLRSVEPGSTDVHDTLSDNALLILHGSATEWTESSETHPFVLLDSVYDELRVVAHSSPGDTKLPSTAKGDCVLTGTEEAKGIICWNGTTYFWEQRGD